MGDNQHNSSSEFTGSCKVQVILEGEKYFLDVDANGPVLLEAAEEAGLDAPYSCRSGVCCSCRAKILSGSAEMQHNYTLTDEDMAEGYILTCQANPTSNELIISYDD